MWHQRSPCQDKSFLSTWHYLLLSRKVHSGSEGTQRPGFDVDTGDKARVRKHPGLTGQHINLATSTTRSYLLCTRAPRGTKDVLPQAALQVLDTFIALLAASILSNKRSPRLCVTSETKPNQDK